MELLKNIDSPADLKKLKPTQLARQFGGLNSFPK